MMNKLLTSSFAEYKPRSIKRDFVAAIVVTALAIPESLGFAALIGLPVETGLYAALLAPIVFALLSSSKRLVIGADSATAALIASGLGTLSIAAASDYTSAVTTVTFIAGVLVALLGLLRFGFLADLISRPVLVGFFGGVGLQLLVTKLPDILGLDASGSVLQKLSYVASHFSDINIATFWVAALVFFSMYFANLFRLPGALVGLLAALAASVLLNLESRGVEAIGAVTSHLPSFILPSWSLDLAIELFPLALSIALVILAQSTATSRAMAVKHDEEVDDNRDLIALGFANIAAAFTQGFSVNGSPPRSAAAEQSGGTSQLVSIFMSLFIGLILLFATDTLQMIPVAALAVIIMSVGYHLIDFSGLKHIYKANKTEFMIALIALLGVALLGVRQGIFIAIMASLAERLRREYRPQDRVLVRDQTIDAWASERLDPHHRFRSKPPGLLVYRFDGAIFFENSNYFTKRLIDVVNEAKEPVVNVIIDAGSITDIDYTGAEALRRTYKLLRTDDTQLTLAHVSPGLMALLEQYDVVELIGKKHIFPTLKEAIKAHPTAQRSTADMVKRLDLPARSYVVIGGGVLDALDIRSTYDVDMVVDKKTYQSLERRGWAELVEDDGKRLLSHNGYKVMRSWVGMDLKRLQAKAFEKDGVWFMNLQDLAAVKAKLGRRKDLRDVELIKKYLSHESSKNL